MQRFRKMVFESKDMWLVGCVRQTSIGTMFPFAIHGKEKNKWPQDIRPFTSLILPVMSDFTKSCNKEGAAWCLQIKWGPTWCNKDMGWWVCQRFKCQDQKHLTISTAYQVSQKSTQSVQMDTAFMQQWSFLNTQQVDPVNPRVQFWQDLSAKMQQFQEEGDKIILMVDANSDFDDVQFLQMDTKHKLLDLHSNLTSLTPPPESYGRRKKKINFILGLLAISQAVVRGGIMDYNNGLKYSDHQALFIDMNEGRLFSAKGHDSITQIRDVRRPSKIRHWMELLLCMNKVFIPEEQLFGFPLWKQSFLLFNLSHYCIGWHTVLASLLFFLEYYESVQIHLIFECIQRNLRLIDFIRFFIFFSENIKSCSVNNGSKSRFLFDWSFPWNPWNAIWKVVEGPEDNDVKQWKGNAELIAAPVEVELVWW